MKYLFETDYVIYDRVNDYVIEWENNGDCVIFGSKEEAQIDCRGNEEVIKCVDLPKHQQEKILKELNRV